MEFIQIASYLINKLSLVNSFINEEGWENNRFMVRAFIRLNVVIGEAIKFLLEDQPVEDRQQLEWYKNFLGSFALLVKIFSASRNRLLHDLLYRYHLSIALFRRELEEFKKLFLNNNIWLESSLVFLEIIINYTFQKIKNLI